MGITPEQKKQIQKKFKIPVDSFIPGTYWIISLDSESQMPTDEEFAQLKSFCEFKVRNWFNERYQKKILEEMALPKYAGQNTVIFRKGSLRDEGENSWFYRRMSWVTGPTYIPDPFADGYTSLSLVEVMDHCENILLERWVAWKREHSDIFQS